MRSTRLLALAAEAEMLRLRHEARALVRTALWRAAAVGFAAFALVMLHIAAWHALAPYLAPGLAGLAIALFDLIAAGVMLVLARPRHDPVAQEALVARRMLVRAARDANPIGELAITVARHLPLAALLGLASDAAGSLFRRRARGPR